MQEMPGPIGFWVAFAAALLLGAFLGFRLWKRDLLPLLGVAWFICFLAPMLPLQNHFSDYYTTIPSFGFAMVAGGHFNGRWWQVGALRGVAAAVVVLFAWSEVAETEAMERWYRSHSGQIHSVLDTLREVTQRRPVDTVLLAGVDDDLYVSGLLDNPFRLYGIQRAYLMPGSESLIRSVPKEKIRLRTDQDSADNLITDGKTLVVAFDGRGIVDVTDIYRAMREGRFKLTTVRMNEKLWVPASTKAERNRRPVSLDAASRDGSVGRRANPRGICA